jgi:arginine deiminase
MTNLIPVEVTSEVGKLEGVILHRPGREVENMTPGNAEKALYSDILNLSVADKEYSDFYDVLSMITNTYEVRDLLTEVLINDKVKHNLIHKICQNDNEPRIFNSLMALSPKETTRQLFEGVVLKKNNLTNFLSQEKYILPPLHNFFFMRDASMSIGNDVLIGKMANLVRERESIIMETIFDYHPDFKTRTFNPINSKKVPSDKITIEGGDVLVANENTLLIGMGGRTTSEGIDYLIDHYKNSGKEFNIIVQELPLAPESFIHLDMVFTFLDFNQCMVYEPVILKNNRLETVSILIRDGAVKISYEDNLITALRKVGHEVEPLFCGGRTDVWTQEREQWHSGTNFFSVAPGKVLGYGRNTHTMDELANHGYSIIQARDIVSKKINIKDYERYCVAIEGSELARGGGGCRCMTMPFKRQPINQKSEQKK